MRGRDRRGRLRPGPWRAPPRARSLRASGPTRSVPGSGPRPARAEPPRSGTRRGGRRAAASRLLFLETVRIPARERDDPQDARLPGRLRALVLVQAEEEPRLVVAAVVRVAVEERDRELVHLGLAPRDVRLEVERPALPPYLEREGRVLLGRADRVQEDLGVGAAIAAHGRHEIAVEEAVLAPGAPA